MTDGPTPTDGRRRDAAATRERLLRAAQRRFTVYGYDGTSTRDIAADADANVSLISRYFGSKEKLYESVLAESTRMMAQHLAERTDEVDDVDSLVRGWLAELPGDAWPQFGSENPLMLLIRQTRTDTRTDDLRTEGVAARLSEMVGTVTTLAGPGRDPALDEIRAELLMTLLLGLTVMRGLLGDRLPTATAESHLEDEVRRVVATILGLPA